MIKTKRLILTPVSTDDLDIYTELFTKEGITRFLPGGRPFSTEYIKNHVPERVAHWSKGFGTFIVSLSSEPSVKIGYAGVETIPEVGLSDIRYAILSEYQGLGYAHESAKAVLDFIFSSGKLAKVYGVAVTENTASIHLLKKLGMQKTNERLYDSDDLVTMVIEAHT